MTTGIVGYEDALAKIMYQSAAVRLGSYLGGSQNPQGLNQDTIARTLSAAYPLLDIDRVRLDVYTSENFYFKLLNKQNRTCSRSANGDLIINVG